MTILFFLIMVITVALILHRIQKLFTPPTLEEQIEEIKSQEGTVRIYKEDTAQPAKPTVQDLGQDVEYEEITEQD